MFNLKKFGLLLIMEIREWMDVEEAWDLERGRVGQKVIALKIYQSGMD